METKTERPSVFEADRSIVERDPDEAAPLTVRTPQSGQTSGQGAELRTLVEIAAGQERDPNALKREARRIGEAMARAGKAMWAFPIDGKRIEGPTVWLAEALGQAYRYLWTGVRVDLIEDERVYLTAIVFDALSGSFLTRPHVATLPPAPKKWAEKIDQVSRWESMQVQSAISKAIRTALLHSLPAWYVECAVQAAHDQAVTEELQGAPLEQVVAEAIAAFAMKLKPAVDRAALARRFGADPALWTVSDVVDARRLYQALKRGETTVAAEFPPVGATTAQDPKAALGLASPPAVEAATLPQPAAEAVATGSSPASSAAAPAAGSLLPPPSREARAVELGRLTPRQLATLWRAVVFGGAYGTIPDLRGDRERDILDAEYPSTPTSTPDPTPDPTPGAAPAMP